MPINGRRTGKPSSLERACRSEERIAEKEKGKDFLRFWVEVEDMEVHLGMRENEVSSALLRSHSSSSPLRHRQIRTGIFIPDSLTGISRHLTAEAVEWLLMTIYISIRSAGPWSPFRWGTAAGWLCVLLFWAGTSPLTTPAPCCWDAANSPLGSRCPGASWGWRRSTCRAWSGRRTEPRVPPRGPGRGSWRRTPQRSARPLGTGRRRRWWRHRRAW